MKEKLKEHIRIVDVARMAGVSAGTVDRVIHNRGKVSDEKLRKIREVLASVDYQPNLMARSLASCRERTLAVIIPAYRDGDYWADVDAGIARAAVGAERFNVRVRRFFFDQYDHATFVRTLMRVRDEHFDGVLLATLFSESVAGYARELDALGIPYVFVDSNIPGCNRLAYFGTSSVDAGAVAAAVGRPHSAGRRHRGGQHHPSGRRRFEPVPLPGDGVSSLSGTGGLPRQPAGRFAASG